MMFLATLMENCSTTRCYWPLSSLSVPSGVSLSAGTSPVHSNTTTDHCTSDHWSAALSNNPLPSTSCIPVNPQYSIVYWSVAGLLAVFAVLVVFSSLVPMAVPVSHLKRSLCGLWTDTISLPIVLLSLFALLLAAMCWLVAVAKQDSLSWTVTFTFLFLSALYISLRPARWLATRRTLERSARNLRRLRPVPEQSGSCLLALYWRLRLWYQRSFGLEAGKYFWQRTWTLEAVEVATQLASVLSSAPDVDRCEAHAGIL